MSIDEKTALGDSVATGSSISLTEADKKVLEKLPDGKWFSIYDITHAIANPYYRCQRLENAGVLESRVTGPLDDLLREWRKI